MPAFLCVRGSPHVYGDRLRDFIFRQELGVYIYQNRELTAEEHNLIAPDIIARNVGLRPYTMVLDTPKITDLSPRVRELEGEVAEKTEEIDRLRMALKPRARHAS